MAAFLDNYGNNATYGKSDEHLFMVNIDGVGMGLYFFKDDTGENDQLISDELSVIAILNGVKTEDVNLGNLDFLV